MYTYCIVSPLLQKTNKQTNKSLKISYSPIKKGLATYFTLLMNAPKTDDRVRGPLNGVGFQKQASFSFPCKFSPKTAKLIVTKKVKLISCLFTTTTVCNFIATTIGSYLLSRFYPNFIQILSRFFRNSLYPDFVWIFEKI